jgi:P27 family predicted phage terminase small subunit
MRKFVLPDEHVEVLRQACLAADRAESCRLQVAQEGLTIAGSEGQPRAHPLIAAENAAQKTLAALLTRIGLFSEARRDKPGRPPMSGRW